MRWLQRQLDTRWEDVFSEGRLRLVLVLSASNAVRQGMAPVGPVKVLLATRPRALLRSTLTAPTSAKNAPLGIAGEVLGSRLFYKFRNKNARKGKI